MQHRDRTFDFKLQRSKMILVLLPEAPVINQPYYFQSDSEITGSKVTSIELVETGVLSDGNISGQVNGYNFMSNNDMTSVCLSLADTKGNIFIDQCPIRLFSTGFIGSTSAFGKKFRTDLQIDPSASFIVWKSTTWSTSFPAVVALNVTFIKE